MKSALRGIAILCVATCITQMIMFGYFAVSGSLNFGTITKVLALLNGIDISGNRLRDILSEAKDAEQPDFDEILAARQKQSLDIDMRLRSQREFRDEIALMLASLQSEKQRFDERREAFDQRLEEINQGALDSGLQEVQRTLQALEADQAKKLIKKIYEEERIDDVVNIIQAMPMDKRKNILAEFTTEPEIEVLHEILRRIGEGAPTTSLIQEARGG